MRYVLFGICVLATACAGASPTAPTSGSAALRTATEASTPGPGGLTQAQGGSELPFKGDLEANEGVDGNVHHLVGTGHGTHLGNFTYTADITVDDETGDGAGSVVWTAANGDRIFATTKGYILAADFPHGRITIGETQSITGGTGRFESASGSVSGERSLDLLTGMTSGTFTGALNRGH